MADKNFIVDNIDNLSIKMKELKEAQREFATYSRLPSKYYEISDVLNFEQAI